MVTDILSVDGYIVCSRIYIVFMNIRCVHTYTCVHGYTVFTHIRCGR